MHQSTFLVWIHNSFTFKSSEFEKVFIIIIFFFAIFVQIQGRQENKIVKTRVKQTGQKKAEQETVHKFNVNFLFSSVNNIYLLNKY